jgi:hypothetical protein
MMNVGGQTFANAYAALEKALGCAQSAAACGASVPPAKVNGSPNPAYVAYINSLATANSQGFFQTAVPSNYCKGTFSNGSGAAYANCTAAVLDNELGNLTTQSVWSLWSDLDNGNFNFPRTMENTPIAGSSFGGNDNEQCVFTSKYNAGNSAHYGVSGGTDAFGNNVGTSVAIAANGNPVAINMFKNPVSVWNQVRAPILGMDTKNPGVGPFTGLPYWNMDLSVNKNFRLFERASFEYSMIFTNVLNHTVLADPGMALYSSSTWGVLSGNINNPRSMEFGLRVRY